MTAKDPELAAFGANLRRHRERAGLSQEALADKADIDRTQVGVIERGIQEPKIKTVLKLARAIGIKPGRLLDGIE